MPKMGYTKMDLLDLIDDEILDNLTLIEDEISDTSRWSVHHTVIFKDNEAGKFYETYYSRGATEYQDESPFEYEPDIILCDEVKPVSKTIIVYKKVK